MLKKSWKNVENCLFSTFFDDFQHFFNIFFSTCFAFLGSQRSRNPGHVGTCAQAHLPGHKGRAGTFLTNIRIFLCFGRTYINWIFCWIFAISQNPISRHILDSWTDFINTDRYLVPTVRLGKGLYQYLLEHKELYKYW